MKKSNQVNQEQHDKACTNERQMYTAQSCTPSIKCLSCGNRFPAEELKGTWRKRFCPSCGKPILANQFDQIASKTIDKRKRASEKELVNGKKSKRLKAIAALIETRSFFPIKKIIEWRAKLAAKRHDQNLQMKGLCTQQLTELALSRYYASEWYQCSGFALSRTKSGILDEYELKSRYNGKAEFVVKGTAGNAFAAGLAGEYCIFEALMECIASKESSLANARLVPNVFLPAAASESAGFADQVDLILLARQCAVVFEIKRWNACIQAAPHLPDIMILSHDGKPLRTSGFKSDHRPVHQAMRGAADLIALNIYPEERIYHAVVFVNPQGFENIAHEFVNRGLIASYSTYSTSTLLPAIEKELLQLDNFFTQTDVDQIADRLLEDFSDRSGVIEQRQFDLRQQAFKQRYNSSGARDARAQKVNRPAKTAGDYLDATAKRKKHKQSKGRAGRPQTHAERRRARASRKQRLYELEWEHEEWEGVR